MELWVRAVGVLGPGLDGWTATRAILAGLEPYSARPTKKPIPDVLPATERRRSGEASRLAIAVAQEAVSASRIPSQELATVFASSDGDGDITHKICGSLAGTDRDVSPTLFHNSVYNAPAGYWSIATGSRSGSTSVCAYDLSFAAGLLEAAVQVTVERQPVMLIASDLPFPAPLHAARPVDQSFAVALLLAPHEIGTPLMRWDITLEAYRTPTAWPSGPGNSLRNNPAARCLPLLAALAGGGSPIVSLDYLDHSSLVVACEV
ncbi:MAG TPA: beta-ketoacyl synthase chain length factor [Nitrospiraceae bacterium]|nr:beta-ketoacyl synthase chain length factor [Nitrospiraceae bacterium]